MDWCVIEQKLESLRKAIARVNDKCPSDAATLARDIDAQDILSVNLIRAVQICVDIAAHLVSGLESAAPETMGQIFDVLSEAGIISADLAGRMKKAVGFRNLAVHNYDAINWTIVYEIAHNHLSDFQAFAQAVLKQKRP
ncbi:MAG: DUF86 domain-containing protein [Chlorobiaceae bacterium]